MIILETENDNIRNTIYVINMKKNVMLKLKNRCVSAQHWFFEEYPMYNTRAAADIPRSTLIAMHSDLNSL